MIKKSQSLQKTQKTSKMLNDDSSRLRTRKRSQKTYKILQFVLKYYIFFNFVQIISNIRFNRKFE